MISYIASLFAGIGLWTAIGVTLVAGLMRGFAGFGSAMLMAPIFAILFGSAEMVVTVVAIELVVSVQLFPQVRRHADWRVLTPMSIAACAAMPLGVWLLASVDKNTIVTAVSARDRGLRRADVERLEVHRPPLDAGQRRGRRGVGRDDGDDQRRRAAGAALPAVGQ